MNKTKKLVFASMFAVIIFVVTSVVKIPIPKGYINLGDSVILIASWMMPPVYSFLAAAVGSMLADVSLGYMVYAPVTFLIKGIMALAAYYISLKKFDGNKNVFLVVLSGVIAEIIMVLGYLVYESFLYGFIPSLANASFNLIQGGINLIVGVLIYLSLNKRINK